MSWYHYTSRPFNKLIPAIVEDTFMKPAGIWLSFNDEWAKWCESANFYTYDPENYEIIEFTFNDDARILIIENYQDIINFVAEYCNENMRITYWTKVAEKYDGIAVLNYGKIKYNKTTIEQFVKMPVWFLVLDCSCACIWNTTTAVSNFFKIKN